MAMLEITSPASGAALNLGSDTDPVAPGVQIDVAIIATALSVGEAVRVEVDGIPSGSATVPSDGMVSITGLTIGSGTHTLVASARSGGVVSDGVTVTVTDSCFAVAFVSPEPGGTLGRADDTDGEACETTFETTVVATTSAPDGSDARIFVNGSSRRTATVAAGQIRFTGVGLDNRVPTANALRVEVTSDGTTCGADLTSGVFVDCAGASCSITAPSTDTPFLNADDDVSAAEGFQGDFAVTTDSGPQPVRLIIDGNESGAASATPNGMVASFDNVELTEGTHRFVAECVDSVGNTSRSGVVEWTVDITPCGVTLDDPAADTLFVDADDLDADPTNGIQILGSGTAGSDCSGLRVGLCSGIDAEPFVSADTSWTSEITLASAAMQDLCAQTMDAAGNASEARVGVRVNTEAPQVEIASPADNTGFNLAGTAGRTADLASGNTTCEAAFEVYCTDVDEDVQLLLSSSQTVIGTATCAADVSVPVPYSGRATFASASLPSIQNGSAFNVFARQTSDRLTGDSAPISLRADCVAPVFSIIRPVCGSTLLPATQDENPGTPAFEYRTVVTRPNDMSTAITLTIESSGGAVVYTATDSVTAPTASFPAADYSAGGLLSVTASGADNAGNVGTTPMCTVTVEDLPEVVLTAPVMDQVLTLGSDDCSADPGLQVQITGTTDAAPGSTVAITVAGVAVGSSLVGAGGAISACVDASDGRMVQIQVSVTDTRGTGTASLFVIVDTMTPNTGIADLAAAVQDRRGGVVRFTWTAVADAGGERLTSYEMRCAPGPISNETEWMGATVVPVLADPAASGAMEVEDIDAFRTGEVRNCVLRGVDPAGALTPLHAALAVNLPWLMETRPALGGFGLEITAVGDVNGDGVDDVLVGGANGADTGAGNLYFGVASAAPVFSASADVTFPGGPFYGISVGGLGDVSGDGIADFAVADPSTGTIDIFFGRTSANPWPATCTGACGPNVTIVAGFFAGVGGVQSAGDFDGDGSLDLIYSDGNALRAVVVLGPFVDGSAFQVPAGANPAPDGFIINRPAAGNAQFGADVAGVGGDASGDGRADVLVTAPTPGGATSYLVRGAMYTSAPGTGLVSLAAANVVQIEAGDAYAVASAGDLNGDGRLDIAVGDNASGARGRLSLYTGDGSGYSTAAGRVFRITNTTATAGGDRFASSLGQGRHQSPLLGNLGDLDGDGRGDVLAGSTQFVGTDGAALLFYSRATLADRTVADASSQLDAPTGSGERVCAFVGDLNGDGFNDLAVGESSASTFHIVY